jgi:hypothetical protein
MSGDLSHTICLNASGKGSQPAMPDAGSRRTVEDGDSQGPLLLPCLRARKPET